MDLFGESGICAYDCMQKDGALLLKRTACIFRICMQPYLYAAVKSISAVNKPEALA